jgi:hypothetical protein
VEAPLRASDGSMRVLTPPPMRVAGAPAIRAVSAPKHGRAERVRPLAAWHNRRVLTRLLLAETPDARFAAPDTGPARTPMPAPSTGCPRPTGGWWGST